ncbi:MAG: 2-oxoglutarate dehydrogenase, E2 component, dihydrolipoamide succinyltransferase [Acidobacteriaceae bacterium]
MSTEVVMPQMGESITEGTITRWLKKVGDTVQRDEPLFEISTDKVDAEIPSPAAGTLLEIKIEEGSTVGINTIVALIGEAGSGTAKPAAAPASSAPAPAAPAAKAPETAKAPAPAAAPATGADKGTDVVMPQMGESITEGTITKWLKKVGDDVQRDEPLFEISTDKVDAEIPSPVAGKLAEIKVAEGATVGIGTVVAVVGGSQPAASASAAPVAAAQAVSAAQAPVAQAPAAQVSAPVVAEAASASQQDRVRSSPLVRKIARENQLDLSTLTGSGAGGRITKDDALAALAHQPKAGAAPAPAAATTPTPAAAPAAKAPAAPLPSVTPGDLVPLTKMRSIIAQRMVESKRTSAHVHTVFKVDMTRIVRIREKEKNKYEQRNGVKLTYMPFIARAVVNALRKYPVLNASVQGEAIQYHKNINIGIAVALEWGLIVPVVKQAEERSFLGIARSIVDLADRARSKKLAPDDVAGGTFTLTNSGIFGEEFGTPIIPQPQVGILGIGGMSKVPAVVSGPDGTESIAIRTMQYFSLGFDHRIVDGSDAGKFMSEFKTYMENWSEDIG